MRSFKILRNRCIEVLGRHSYHLSTKLNNSGVMCDSRIYIKSAQEGCIFNEYISDAPVLTIAFYKSFLTFTPSAMFVAKFDAGVVDVITMHQNSELTCMLKELEAVAKEQKR